MKIKIRYLLFILLALLLLVVCLDYLLGIPLLGDYLAEGLEKMGLSDVRAEEEVLGIEERTAPPET